MEYIELIGFAAGTIAIGAFLPQAIKTFKTKQTADLSSFMLILQMTCVGLWMIYGILKQLPSLIICNFFTLITVSSVFAMKLLFDKRNPQVPSDL